MSKLRQLIEAANRKCEMAWKVYSYNPEKDNELVDTSKAFDCIAAAQAHKRDILEKNPNYTVEIIAESSQKNESKFSSQSAFNKAKDIAKDLQMTLIENSDGSLRRDKIHDYNYSMSIGEVAFYVDDWGYGTQEYNKYKNANIKTLSKGWKIELDNIVSNANKKYKDYDISYSMSSDGKRIYFKIVESKNESAQKNEATFKPGDKVSVKSYYKDGNQFITLHNATIIKEITEKEAGQLDPAYNWKEPTGMKYYLVKLDTGYKKAVLASDLTLESAQKNEDLSKHPKLQEVWSKWKFNTKYGLHYTSNAKDTQAYLAKITKPNTFWLEDEDTGKAIVQGTPKDLINFMLSHKNAIDESAQKSESKVNMSKLKNEIQAAVNKYFKDDKDLLEYVYIDTKKDKLGRDILEVRAELGYNNMVKLADYLDKIVTKYDKYAYFDQETSGIMTAVFESAQINESLRDLNLELADDTNAIAASADKIRQRFEYRTLQNQSYDEKQAEKIYLEVRRELEKAKKMIDACYNKIG